MPSEPPQDPGLGKPGPNGKHLPSRIRPAAPGDLPALLALENACFSSDRMSRRAFRHALSNPLARLAVIPGADGSLLAAALMLGRSDSRAMRIYSIAVHPSARGQGLARRLLSHMESLAQKSGAQEMRLEVSVRNHAALALYRESGYEITRRVTGYYEDGADALRLAKPLAPPARAHRNHR